MTERDIERVREIEQRSFTTLWSAATYRRELRNPHGSRYIVVRASPTPPPPNPVQAAPQHHWLTRLFALFLRNQTPPSPFPIVGYGGVWLSLTEGHITTIAVAPEWRGHGLGELILAGLIDEALGLGATVLTLEVRVSNNIAQQLYLKYGFRPAGTRQRYYTDNNEDALMMWTDSIREPAYQERLRQLRSHLFERLRAQAGDHHPPSLMPYSSAGTSAPIPHKGQS
ncbi:MAG TPA: ribosomal protein S18-alanine N-acetyltransferase [Roseiflexaceae bacterium]|nr:ribosomal protein S18-alanine N-acetyltransferase [Roseiflexaceae bacterium]